MQDSLCGRARTAERPEDVFVSLFPHVQVFQAVSWDEVAARPQSTGCVFGGGSLFLWSSRTWRPLKSGLLCLGGPFRESLNSPQFGFPWRLHVCRRLKAWAGFFSSRWLLRLWWWGHLPASSVSGHRLCPIRRIWSREEWSELNTNAHT